MKSRKIMKVCIFSYASSWFRFHWSLLDRKTTDFIFKATNIRSVSWIYELFSFSLLQQNIENNNNDVKWRRTPPLSRSKTLPDLLYQSHDGPHLTFNKDSPAPCKIFPKTPKIALTIDDISFGDFQRRKSSGSSVNSNQSAIEPHIYDFQDSEKTVESSLIIRFELSKFPAIHRRPIFTFHLRIPSCTHLASAVTSDLPLKLQNPSNSTFYRFTRLLNNKPTVNASDERRTSWDKR